MFRFVLNPFLLFLINRQSIHSLWKRKGNDIPPRGILNNSSSMNHHHMRWVGFVVLFCVSFFSKKISSCKYMYSREISFFNVFYSMIDSRTLGRCFFFMMTITVAMLTCCGTVLNSQMEQCLTSQNGKLIPSFPQCRHVLEQPKRTGL